MTTLSLNPRYPGLAHRGALRRASRYDPFGTLSLITGFVSRLKGRRGDPFSYSTPRGYIRSTVSMPSVSRPTFNVLAVNSDSFRRL
ncbi:hypothetical protein BSR03_15865 [Serratia proteamaculans]|nr:hypothetical protein E4343_02100 [Serratia quinivorans]RYM59932.1 hypothetical protein BSR03_15865 [Serratia proteamaculans]